MIPTDRMLALRSQADCLMPLCHPEGMPTNVFFLICASVSGPLPQSPSAACHFAEAALEALVSWWTLPSQCRWGRALGHPPANPADVGFLQGTYLKQVQCEAAAWIHSFQLFRWEPRKQVTWAAALAGWAWCPPARCPPSCHWPPPGGWPWQHHLPGMVVDACTHLPEQALAFLVELGEELLGV